jgi:hypothetical protein
MEVTVLAEPRTVVLVEGQTDQAVLRALARRLGRDLDAERVHIFAIGGAMNIGRAVAFLGATRAEARLVGLCDEQEAPLFRRVLADVFVCVRDLEDELVRALGIDAVLDVLAAHGERASFEVIQKQPAWRGRPREEQLRRFLRSQSRRAPAGTWFVEALDLNRIPPPLAGLLEAV